MGRGCQCKAYVEANPQTPPSSHHHPEHPPVLPSIKGSPFTDRRTGGRPPGDDFCASRGWPVSGPDSEPRMRTQAPPPQASLGATFPPLSNQAGSQVPWASDPGNGSPSCPQRTSHFPLATLPSSSPAPASAECPGRTWGPGARAGPSQGYAPGEEGQGGRSPRPWKGSPGRTQACAPPGPLRVLLWLKLPNPAPRCQTWSHLPPLSNICPKLLEKGL